MNDELRKKLLTRKFSSIEYMEEMTNYHQLAIDGMIESIKWFNDNPPKDVDWENWHISEKPEEWERRALPNFRMTQEAFEEGIEKAKQDDISCIVSATGSIRGLSKDMDVLGDLWWDYVDRDVVMKFGSNMNAAKKRASNIWWTLRGSWKENEILNTEITGPIDENDLLRYLKPNEK